MVKRGDVWSTAKGHCVILSPTELIGALPTVIVAPMSTVSAPAPFRIPVRFGGKHGVILIDHLRAVQRRSLLRPLGRVDSLELSGSLDTLIEFFTP